MEADGPNGTGGWVVNKKGMVSGGGPHFSPSLYRLCGRAGTGNCSPGPGDPGRPGGRCPAHWGHHVAKTARQKRGKVSEKAKQLRLGTTRQQGGVWGCGGRNDGALETMCRILPNPPPQEGPRKPGGGGGARRAESVRGARGS